MGWWSKVGRVAVGIALCAVAGGATGLGCGTGDDAAPLAGDDTTDAAPAPSTIAPPVDAAPVDAGPPFHPHDAGTDAPARDANPPDLAPAPVLASIAPSDGVLGSAGPTIVCTGSGFVPRSVVQIDGVALTTTFASDTELRATIPDDKMLQVGPIHVTVGTAPPGGGGSAEVDFEVLNPAPVMTSLAPTSVLVGAKDTPLTVKGSAFVTGATISVGGQTLATAVVGATTLTTTIPAAQLATSGQLPVVVTNPTPGGGASSPIAFTVANPTVTVTKVTPDTIVLGSGATPIALLGTGFVAASAVSFNGATIASTFVDATHLSATVPATALQSAADFPVVVTNPAPGGGVSTPVTVHVVYPAPTATSLSPSSVVLGAPPPTVTVTGAGFLTGVTSIAFDGAAAPTNVIDATHVSATLPTAAVQSAHVVAVTVSNPSPGGGTSAALSFTVLNPTPVATSVAPSSAVVGAGDTPITVSGSSFVAGSTVLVGGAPLATTFGSDTSLSAVLPAARLATAGTLSLSVSSPAPGGGASGTLSFVVDNPGPTINDVTPSSATVPAADTAIVVSGAGFVPNVSVIQIGGASVPTTYGSASPLTLGATIPAAQLATAGTLSITVANPAPGGGTSNVAFFTANNPPPTLTSVSPSSVAFGAASTPITLAGSGFVDASVVKANGTTLTSATQNDGSITATVPSSMLTGGNLSITVTNPAPGGGTSAAKTITVQCTVTGDLTFTATGQPTSLTLNLAQSTTSASRITLSDPGGPASTCPAVDDTTGFEPYRAYVVANQMTKSATLAAWAVCGSTDDGFLALYSRATVPTTQTQLEQCTGVISEGQAGAGGYNSKEPGGSTFCPGLTKANGGGLTMAACSKAVVVLQAWSTTNSSYTPPTTLKVELE